MDTERDPPWENPPRAPRTAQQQPLSSQASQKNSTFIKHHVTGRRIRVSQMTLDNSNMDTDRNPLGSSQRQTCSMTKRAAETQQSTHSQNTATPTNMRKICRRLDQAHGAAPSKSNASAEGNQEGTHNKESNSYTDSEKCKTRRRLSSYIHLSPHVPEHKIQPLDPQDTAQLLWNYRRDHYTSKYTPADAFQLLFHHHLQAQEVMGYRVYTTNKRKPGDSDACGQEHYLTQMSPSLWRNGL